MAEKVWQVNRCECSITRFVSLFFWIRWYAPEARKSKTAQLKPIDLFISELFDQSFKQ
jgi:hypothetical protein